MSKSLQTISLTLLMVGLVGCYFGGRRLTPLQFPEFPWSPPKASALITLPDEYFQLPKERAALLSDIDNLLSSALRYAGYGEKSYYAVPDGFALVSRLEQINPDGTPKFDMDRWATKVKPLRKFSLESYLNALFTSQLGYFRVIVFVVTPHPFLQSGVRVSSDEVKVWVHNGLNKLPSFVGVQEYTLGYSVTALIYELKKENGQNAVTLIPGNLSAITHLEKSSIMKGLMQ